jgi:hypothetical protein
MDQPTSVVLTAAQAEALSRAQALAAELGDLVAALRAPPEAAPAPAAPTPAEPTLAAALGPPPEAEPPPAAEPAPVAVPEPDETLAAGELRAAFAAAAGSAPRRRPRWAQDLLE